MVQEIAVRPVARASRLRQLLDVAVPSVPPDQSLLRYDRSVGKWVPSTPPTSSGAASATTTLTDPTTPTHRIEIFDANGVSLGFLPVYPASSFS